MGDRVAPAQAVRAPRIIVERINQQRQRCDGERFVQRASPVLDGLSGAQALQRRVQVLGFELLAVGLGQVMAVGEERLTGHEPKARRDLWQGPMNAIPVRVDGNRLVQRPAWRNSRNGVL